MSEHESDAALSRRVAEAAGWTLDTDRMFAWHAPGGNVQRPDCPPFATSLDAIAALEREAGLRVDVEWSYDDGDLRCVADAYQKNYRVGHGEWVNSDHAEPRARCLAYLATKERTT
jgi:hypothetical protein